MIQIFKLISNTIMNIFAMLRTIWVAPQINLLELLVLIILLNIIFAFFHANLISVTKQENRGIIRRVIFGKKYTPPDNQMIVKTGGNHILIRTLNKQKK